MTLADYRRDIAVLERLQLKLELAQAQVGEQDLALAWGDASRITTTYELPDPFLSCNPITLQLVRVETALAAARAHLLDAERLERAS